MTASDPGYEWDGFTMWTRPFTPEQAAAAAAVLEAIPDPPDQWQPGDLGRHIWDRSLGRYVMFSADPATGDLVRDPDGNAIPFGVDEMARTLDSISASVEAAVPWPLPEDRGHAVRSSLGDVEYVTDLIKPGRIIVVSGEEGTGKSYAIGGELCIRMACAGGSFAGTWDVLRRGPVLVLSEMHDDDDYDREQQILDALGHQRSELSGHYYRIPLMTAAGDRPALMVPEWREWVTGWIKAHGVMLLVVDTATGATQVKPWGEEIQQVYRSLRLMLKDCPELAIALLLHMRKPSGKGERGLSAVMGEWGRWCDVVLMMENDGNGFDRVKLTSRKRVHKERRIIATKRDGLLVDPVDADTPTGPKVPMEDVIAAVEASPGLTYKDLGAALGVSADTASRYVAACGDRLDVVKPGKGKAHRVMLRSSAAPQSAA